MKSKLFITAITAFLFAHSSFATTETIVLQPSEYGIFFFNNGAGRLEIDDLPSRLTQTFTCNTSFTVEFLTDTDLSDRVVAGLLTARAAEASIRVQITDDGTSVGANCRFNGIAVQPTAE